MKKSYDSYAVIGLGFGDEGKGVTVNSLCQQLPRPLVVRYSGGQQAGHTVTLKDGTSHVFSNFGSGSLKGAPTYWSKYCTFDPVGFINELQVLASKRIYPQIYIDKRSPVTTPHDKFYNQDKMNDAHGKHGTCGAGVGPTFAREEKFYSLLAGDLMYPSVLKTKLELIGDYYHNRAELGDFMMCCELIRKNFTFVDGIHEIPVAFPNIIFEGSQGLLLDQHIGFFPHVTRSNVGTTNIVEMGYSPRLLLVTRAFQTRHGYGPMTNFDIPHNIKDDPRETNKTNQYQGEFCKSLLDLDLLKYGIDRDPFIRASKDKELVITCMDLVENELRYTVNGKIVSCRDEREFSRNIAAHLDIADVHTTHSPDDTITIGFDNGR